MRHLSTRRYRQETGRQEILRRHGLELPTPQATMEVSRRRNFLTNCPNSSPASEVKYSTRALDWCVMELPIGNHCKDMVMLLWSTGQSLIQVCLPTRSSLSCSFASFGSSESQHEQLENPLGDLQVDKLRLCIHDIVSRSVSDQPCFSIAVFKASKLPIHLFSNRHQHVTIRFHRLAELPVCINITEKRGS